jgi:hypothetical protein
MPVIDISEETASDDNVNTFVADTALSTLIKVSATLSPTLEETGKSIVATPLFK